jgi:signal transduction histidine kinase
VKLGTRLALAFGATLALSILMTVMLAHWELVVEANDPVTLAAEGPEPMWLQLSEIAVRAAIPMLLLVVGGWWLIRRALRPVEELAAAARRINECNLGERLPLRGTGDELDDLINVFNEMTARLESSFQRISDFTLHASHELKTPLAILRADYGELLDEPGRPEADRTRFAGHLDEVLRLSRLVDGLNFLTRADAQLLALAREPVALDALVREAAENTAVLGEAAGLTAQLGTCPPTTVIGDRHRLRQILLILCDNAVKYNRPNGDVRLSLETDGATAVLRLSNTGPGIGASQQSKVFERFYRGDAALADSIDGCGLGLSIASLLAREHGGTLSFSSVPDATEFRLTLPVAAGGGVTAESQPAVARSQGGRAGSLG